MTAFSPSVMIELIENPAKYARRNSSLFAEAHTDELNAQNVLLQDLKKLVEVRADCVQKAQYVRVGDITHRHIERIDFRGVFDGR